MAGELPNPSLVGSCGGCVVAVKMPDNMCVCVCTCLYVSVHVYVCVHVCVVVLFVFEPGGQGGPDPYGQYQKKT